MKTAHEEESVFIQFEEQMDVDGIMSLPAWLSNAVMNC